MNDAARTAPGASAGEILLTAKFSVPQLRTPVVDRPRLTQLVSRGVAGPLTVVSGAAGAGKTMLLASWIGSGSAPGPVAWLTLDPADDQPGVFWAYVIQALRRTGTALPDDVGQPFLATHVARPLLARVADSLATGTGPVVLVLDQFDVITHRVIRDELDFVLRNSGSMLRLVLLCRHEAPLPLHRYELQGELVRIGNADLAFTHEEAAELLRQHGVRLAGEMLATLTEQTRGWAAGLRLSALTMQRWDRPEDFAGTLPGGAPALTGYLVDEVLDVQSEGTREFLLRTCVVDQVCSSLADALTGRSDGGTVLAALRTGNALLEEVGRASGWYRYHPLFAQVLRAELARRHPELVTDLHGRASAWCRQAGLLVEAVEHAAAAGDWQLATLAVVRLLGVAELLAGRQSARLDGEFSHMPPDEPGAMPALVRAARAMVRFDLDACREHLAFADKLADQESLDDRAPLLASVAVVRAVLARAEGDILTAEAALAEGEAQLALVPELAEGHPEMAALLLSNVGTVQLWAGRTDEAERTLRRALAASTGPGCEYPRLNVLGRLAMAEFRRGRLRRAARLGQEELAFAEDSGLPVAYRTGAGHLVLAMVALEWNDRPAVRRHLDDTEKTVGARRDPFVATAVPLLRAWQHAEAGDHRRAVAAVAHVPSTFAGRPLPAWLATRISMAAAALHLKRGETGAASAALEAAPERGPEWAVARAGLALATGDRATAEQLLAPFLAGDVPQIEATTIQAWLLAAMLRQRDGDPAAAREALERALTLARPEGHRRVFLEARAWVGQMLRAHPDLAAAHGWLGAPLVAAGAAQPQPGRAIEEPPRALIEPLTERETTVLARMAQAMSTDDIAQDLFVSLNTVKTHQRSIYRKLAVSRKNEAVRKARQLGLV